jgi:hypothetical protein
VVSDAEKAHEMRQVRAEKANVSEPLMTCRKRRDDIKTRVPLLPWDKPGGDLLTALAVSGTEVARARFRLQHETWETLAPIPAAKCWMGWREGEPQAAETVRGRVLMRGREADRPVVAVMSGNAGGAKGTGCPGLFGDQLGAQEESGERTEAAGQAV